MAIHFILLSLTGSVLLFREELTGASSEHHESAETFLAQDILAAAKLQAPTSRPLSLTFKDAETVEVRLGLNDSTQYRQSHRLYFTPTGQATELKQQQSGWMDWTLRLHRELLLGSNGKIYIGLIGIIYTFTLISGFLIYGPFHKKFGFGEIRRSNTKTYASDLHKYLGIVCLSWGLIIGISGAFLGLSSTLIKLFQYQELQYLNQKYPTKPEAPWASLDQVLESAQEGIPEGTFEFLAFPDTQFSPPGHFLVLFHGSTPLTEKLVELVVVDAVTGELTDVRPLPWYLKVTLLSEPLHFGNYGGLGLKVLWLILNMASLTLPILGILIWRRKSKRLAPGKNIYLLPKVFNKKEVSLLIAGLIGIFGCFFLEGIAALVIGTFVTTPAVFSLLALKLLKKSDL